MFEKEGIVKEKKICLTNLAAENESYLSPREHERVRLSREASQALGTHPSSYFKAEICVNLMCDNEGITEDIALA